jgi:hypothetical protein
MERSIEAATTIRVAFARAREALIDDPAALFNDTKQAGGQRARRFPTDLGVNLGAGASVHQEVMVRLGIPRATEDGLALPLAWRATGRERWLPTFTGELSVAATRSGTRLRLSGAYTVPLGAVGKFGHGLVGRRLARRSLDAFVDGVAARLEAAVITRIASVNPRRRPSDVDTREQSHPEIYVG